MKIPTDDNLSRVVYSGEEASAFEVLLQSITEDTVKTSSGFVMDVIYVDLVTEIASLIRSMFPTGECRIKAGSTYTSLIYFTGGLLVVRGDYETDALRKKRTHIDVSIAGEQKAVIKLTEAIREKYGHNKLATVKWLWSAGDKIEAHSIVLDAPQKVYSEFYPWLSKPVNDYFEEYLDSSASILFMSGPPGTGKTSLIRHVLHQFDLNAMVTYEGKLLGTDGMFVEFLLSESQNILVIEDADVMLTSRSDDGNKLISRFLNISDGLIKFPKKKIIFTTNLANFRRVDDALTRPGRCFEALEGRALTYEEAKLACYVADLETPDYKPEILLTELFNRRAVGNIDNRKVVGFSQHG